MGKHKVKIYKHGRCSIQWINFIKSCPEDEYIMDYLMSYNGHSAQHPYIEFDTEEDFVIFKLKFS